MNVALLKYSLCGALLAGAFGVSQARAEVIVFTDGEFVSGFPGPHGQGMGSYVESGFLVQWPAGDILGYGGADGTLELNPFGTSANFYIRAADGSRFTLSSFNLGVLPGPFRPDLQTGQPVANSVLIGYALNLGAEFTRPATMLDLRTGHMTTVTTSLSDIIYAHIFVSASNPSGTGNTFNIDNVVVHSAVPEPDTSAMVLLGILIGIAIRSSRRTRGRCS